MKKGWKQRKHLRTSSKGKRFKAGSLEYCPKCVLYQTRSPKCRRCPMRRVEVAGLPDKNVVVKGEKGVAVYKPEFFEAMKKPLKRLPKKDYSAVLTGPGTTTMDAEIRKVQGKEFIAEFEAMRDMAELRALSKASLERQLTQTQYERMKELGKKRGLIK